MGDAETFDGKITDLKGASGREKFARYPAFLLVLGGFVGLPVAEHWNSQFARKSGKTGHVIAVFVRDEDSTQPFGCPSNHGEPFTSLARAESGIHQNAGLPVFDEGTVAAGTAA